MGPVTCDVLTAFPVGVDGSPVRFPVGRNQYGWESAKIVQASGH